MLRIIFGFSRTEANGFVLLLLLLMLLLIYQPVANHYRRQAVPDISRDVAYLDSLLDTNKHKPQALISTHHAQAPGAPCIAFNPNDADVATLKRAGIPYAIANRIVHYRNKGGRFSTKSDVLKIYGVDKPLYNRVYACIVLPETPQPKTQAAIQNTTAVVLFDINKADTTQLKALPGIGTVLAKRIVKYRQRLGGYINTDQLKDVYGLDSTLANTVSRKMYVAPGFKPVQVNINRANAFTLSGHPYVTGSMAKALVAYRYQHGNFAHVNDIRKIQSLTEQELIKILPYLTVE